MEPDSPFLDWLRQWGQRPEFAEQIDGVQDKIIDFIDGSTLDFSDEVPVFHAAYNNADTERVLNEAKGRQHGLE
jgi:hypothetical protein